MDFWQSAWGGSDACCSCGCRETGADRQLTNTRFQTGDLLTFLRDRPDKSADVVLLVEISIFLPALGEVLQEISRVMRPNGLLFAAFRSQFYNLLQTIRAQLWDSAEKVANEREGRIFGGPTLFTWQTPEDAHRMLSAVGLRMRSLRGIGVFSGVKADPLAPVAQPSRLSPEERERLMKLECQLAELYAQVGRYMLAIAEK